MKLLFSVLKLIFHNLINFPLGVVDGTMREEHHVDTKGKVGCVGGPSPLPPLLPTLKVETIFASLTIFPLRGKFRVFRETALPP